MPKVKFEPSGEEFEVNEGLKILAAATRNKIPIRFGCGACRCGTCGVELKGDGKTSEMADNERALLERMKLPLDGHIRLACQTKILEGEITVDLDFQDKYSPDSGLD